MPGEPGGRRTKQPSPDKLSTNLVPKTKLDWLVRAAVGFIVMIEQRTEVTPEMLNHKREMLEYLRETFDISANDVLSGIRMAVSGKFISPQDMAMNYVLGNPYLVKQMADRFADAMVESLPKYAGMLQRDASPEETLEAVQPEAQVFIQRAGLLVLTELKKEVVSARENTGSVG